MKKSTLIYVYDGLCSWCYAIEKEVKAVMNAYHEKLDLQLVSGGMFIGDQRPRVLDVFPLEKVKQAYAQVSEYGKVEISSNYLDKLIAQENYRLDSELTGIALAVYQSFEPNRSKDIIFVEALQKNLYIHGLNPNEDAFYQKTAEDLSLDAATFLQRMKEDKYREKAFEDFKYAKALGVTSYPQLIVKATNGQYYLLTKGYSDAATLKKRLDSILKEIEA